MHAAAEIDLIEQARAGSRPAFSRLIASYEDRLYRFLCVRAHSHADAEDAMQESFVNAWRYIDSYDRRWQFSTWLYRIAIRELSKLPPPAMATDKDAQIDANAIDPLSQCIEQDDRENLWLLAREALSAEAFTTLWLRYAEDLSVREVARALGRPETWVKVVAHRAKKRLAAQHRSPRQAKQENKHPRSTQNQRGLTNSGQKDSGQKNSGQKASDHNPSMSMKCETSL